MLGWREACAVMLARSLSSTGHNRQLTLPLAFSLILAMLPSSKILVTSALVLLSKLPG
jgi:hypothetical protein